MVDYVAKLNELETNAKSWAEPLNKANEEKNMTDADKAQEHIANILKEYSDTKRDEIFISCRNADDPMKAACEKLKYSVLKLKSEKNQNQTHPTYSIEYTDKQIDLLALHKFCNPDGIGHDATWMYKIEKFGLLMAAKVADDVGDDPKRVNDSYYMKYQASREVDFGKNPLSNNQMLKTVQVIISAMLGEEYKANLHDVKYIKYVIAKDSKKCLGLDILGYRKLVNMMEKICHRILIGGKWTVNFKVEKA